jgi:pimeloyl-ACP methyl ester carboxylesterase
MHTPTTTVTRHTITGHGGVRLNVEERGAPDGPAILFVHGWSQSALCWDRQLTGDLAARFRLVALDLRGHGMSDAPAGPGHYASPRPWAGDLAAVIGELELDRPIVVAWSYGGLVVTDYVREHGDGALGGIDLVGAATALRPPAFEGLGPGLLENAEAMCSPDLETVIDALPRFLRACTAEPLPETVWTRAVGWNMAVRSDVRAALIARDVDAADVLSTLTVPVLVTHGRADGIVLPSMAERVLDVCPTARASWYDGVGHMPFVEAAERFDAELAAFAAGRATARRVPIAR